MTRLTRPNRRLEAAPRQQQQGLSHLMGPHQVLLGKGCVTGWEPAPCVGNCCSPAFLPLPKRARAAQARLARGRSWRLPWHGPPSAPLQKIRRALSAQGEQLEELILSSRRAQNALERRVFGGTVFAQKHPKRGNVSNALDSRR